MKTKKHSLKRLNNHQNQSQIQQESWHYQARSLKRQNKTKQDYDMAKPLMGKGDNINNQK